MCNRTRGKENGFKHSQIHTHKLITHLPPPPTHSTKDLVSVGVACVYFGYDSTFLGLVWDYSVGGGVNRYTAENL